MNQPPVQKSSFADFNLSTSLLNVLDKIGYHQPTPVQEKTIPCLLEGKDVIAQAQTGTGKTAAFSLPLLDKLNPSIASPQILVLAPTRELATQVAENISLYSQALKQVQVACLCGGQDYRQQHKQLKSGAHIVVGTPGRVMDHMRRGTLVLKTLQAFVLDEADEMLRMGFIEDVEWILEHLPKTRQMALFSATMPPKIRAIANNYLVDANHITIQSKTATVSKIEQKFLFVKQSQKNDALYRLLATEQVDGSIVFVRTKSLTEDVSRFLVGQGFKSKAINGDIAQKNRMEAVDDLKNGAIDILVATDVAARGLDIQRISHVINYDMPFDVETYVHRIGRTGRAGRSGQAVMFATPNEARMLNKIERHTKQKITKIQVPTDHDVHSAHFNRLSKQVKEKLNEPTALHYQQFIKQLIEESNSSAIDIASAIASIAWPISAKANQNNVKAKEYREPKPKKKQSKQDNELGQIVYQLDVGKNHGVKPANIIGAIANEAGLAGKHIKDLVIHNDHSTVSLPEGMPKAIFHCLKKARVCGRQLNLTVVAS